ncbi:hypothetical protein ROTO_19360 [Roseovarius tolerans]|jgi:hypothetical protein|uniref:Uncharacterized protein n=1 Tax=Roseovarius tolerans TaxID=74031 RepID=A0A0L6CUY9_9RHOB|nr:hypothetical protein [Roseovarius tolerans]KNX41536.1 hypothetical protein ROTO_19360 [Roseovarius tolerans]SEM24267.1 hypothetical protein SAMN04488077_103121 [Roseovarius tolerans]
MIRTIQTGSCTLIQGMFVKLLENGFMQVRVDDRLFVGRPVSSLG